MMAMKLTPLMKKHPATPALAMSGPEIAGPKMRPQLNAVEFNDTAFSASSRVTSSNTIACRVGMSKALIVPRQAAISMICQT